MREIVPTVQNALQGVGFTEFLLCSETHILKDCPVQGRRFEGYTTIIMALHIHVFLRFMNEIIAHLTYCSHTQFILFEDSEVEFCENRAELVGGALLVRNPAVAQDTDPVYNTNCFFQYNGDTSTTPDKWVNTITTCL